MEELAGEAPEDPEGDQGRAPQRREHVAGRHVSDFSATRAIYVKNVGM
jgi:hypothetical protein